MSAKRETRGVSTMCAVMLACLAGSAKAQEPRPCPRTYQLTERLRTSLEVSPDVDLRVACVGGAFPDPAWAVVVDVDDPTASFSQVFVVSATVLPAVLARSEAVPRTDQDVLVRSHHLQVLDLDGDGRDELFWRGADCSGDECHQFLRVLVRDGAGLTEAGHFITERVMGAGGATPAEPSVYVCGAAFAAVTEADGSRLLVADGLPPEVGGPETVPTGTCLRGPHAWRLRGGELEAVPGLEAAAAPTTWLVERLWSTNQGRPEIVRIPWSAHVQPDFYADRDMLRLESPLTTLLAPPVWLIDPDDRVEMGEALWGVGYFVPSVNRRWYASHVSFAVVDTRRLRDPDTAAPAVVLSAEQACEAVEPFDDPRLWLVITGSLPMTGEESMAEAAQRVDALAAAGFPDAEAFDGRRAPLLSCCYLTVVAGRFVTREEAESTASRVQAAGFDAYVKAGWEFSFTEGERWSPPGQCVTTTAERGGGGALEVRAGETRLPDIAECVDELQQEAPDPESPPARSEADARCEALMGELLPHGESLGTSPLARSSRVLRAHELLARVPEPMLMATPELERVAAVRIGEAPVCAALLRFDGEETRPSAEPAGGPILRRERWLVVVPIDEAVSPQAPSSDDASLIQLAFAEVRSTDWGLDLARGWRLWAESFEGDFLGSDRTRVQRSSWRLDEGYHGSRGRAHDGVIDEVMARVWGEGISAAGEVTSEERWIAVLLFDAAGRLAARHEICRGEEEGDWLLACEVDVGVAHDIGLPRAGLFIDRSEESAAEWDDSFERVILLWTFEPDGRLAPVFEAVIERESRSVDPESGDRQHSAEAWTYEIEPAGGDRLPAIVLTRVSGGDGRGLVRRYEPDERGVFRPVEAAIP